MVKTVTLSDEQMSTIVQALLVARVDLVRLANFPQITAMLWEVDDALNALGYSVTSLTQKKAPK